MYNDDDEKTPPLAEAGFENADVSDKETSEFYPQEIVSTSDICAEPKANPQAALAFLQSIYPNSPVTITAILSDPNQRPANWPRDAGKTFTRTLTDGLTLKEWVASAADAGVNLYYTANVLVGNHTKKPEKKDIVAAKCLYCDIDPRVGEPVEDEQRRILAEVRSFSPSPTAVVFSGGGYQCLWRLNPEVPISGENDIAAIESRNRWLQSKFFYADNTQNIDRLLRLPGSINHPDERKKKKGRKAALAYVVAELTDWSRTYSLGDIPQQLPSNAGLKNALIASDKTLDDIIPKRLESLNSLVDGWDIPKAVSEIIVSGKAAKHPSRSEAVFFVVCQLVRYGVPDPITLGILLDPRFGISESILEHKNKAEAYAKRQVERAKESVACDIVVEDGDLIRIIAQAEQALLRANAPIFKRGEMLTRTAVLEKKQRDDGVQRDAGATILLEVRAKWLVEQMAQSADWYKRKNKKLVPTDPVEKYAYHLIERNGDWPYRNLRAITHTPTLREDGSVLQTEGYDAASWLLYQPNGVTFPTIPNNPTREDAANALALLQKPFAEFPFVSEASRSVILAAVLTGLIRPSLRTSPMFCIDAPTAGTGKSLLAEMVGLIVTGNIPAMMSQGKNEEEDEKRLSTVLRVGDPVIVIDNCEGELRGVFLCSMLTQELVQARILGKSEMVRLPNNSIVMATGNNITVAGDMCRRVLLCRIDAKEERPDGRQFTFDARQMVREQRPALVAAGLIILRAYIAAGKPNKMPVVGSFEDWNLVREALVWLGAGDPYETSREAMEHDPRKNELLEMLAAWHDCFKDKPQTLAAIGDMYAATYGSKPNEKIAHLYRLLTDISGRPIFNTKSVGSRLRRHVGRVVGGMMLRCEKNDHGAKWSVVRLADTAQYKLPLNQDKEGF
jgi:hypothetical protein